MENPLKMDINERINELIKVLGLNINSFARGLGMPRSTVISQIVKGIIKNGALTFTKPSYETIIAIVTFYKVSPSWLLLGEGPMFSVDVSIVDTKFLKEKDERIAMLQKALAEMVFQQELLEKTIAQIGGGQDQHEVIDIIRARFETFAKTTAQIPQGQKVAINRQNPLRDHIEKNIKKPKTS